MEVYHFTLPAYFPPPHLAIFVYLARLPVYHFTIVSNLVRMPGSPIYHFTDLAPGRFGGLSFYQLILPHGIHISIFADLAHRMVYRFTDLAFWQSIALPFYPTCRFAIIAIILAMWVILPVLLIQAVLVYSGS